MIIYVYMNLYDFDKTIFDGESSSEFYFFLIKRHPKLFWHFFVALFYSLCKIFHLIPTKTYKEKTLGILKYIKEPQREVREFGKKKKNQIFAYYLKNRQESDVICSASPEFLVKEIMSHINPSAIIVASQISLNTGKFEKGFNNCKGNNKVKYLKDKGLTSFENGFSDSKKDKPMLTLCQNKYKIKNGKISQF